MDPNVLRSFNGPPIGGDADMVNPQSAFLNALKFKNRPSSSSMVIKSDGLSAEGAAKRLTVDDNGRIVEVDSRQNNVKMPPEVPQFELRKETPQAPLPVSVTPLPLIPIQTPKSQKKKVKSTEDPFTFKTGSITRQDDFDVNKFGWDYETANT